MKKTYSVISYIILTVFSLVTIGGVSAQNLGVFGEIKSTGKVFIGSSSGNWSPAMPAYPLLQDTGIRIEDGSASIFLKDGSRVDLSRDTIVSISGEAPNYTINLAKGVLVFSITPTSSLAVSTPSASILVNSKDGIVQKVGHEKSSRILGVISSNEKGTEVRSISGRIVVASSTAGTKTLVTGESMLVGPESNYKAYKTQVVGGASVGGTTGGGGALLAVGTAVGEGLALYGLNHTFTHNDKPASPSVP